MDMNYEGNVIKLEKFLAELFKHKLSNLIIITLFVLFGYLYYKVTTPVYMSRATIEIKNPQPTRDNMLFTLDTTTNLETDKDILKSDRLIERTIKTLGGFVDYNYHQTLKTITLYKNTPFVVKNFIIYNPELYGTELLIHDIGENHYRLEVKHSFLKKNLSRLGFKNKKYSFENQVYTYNKPFATKDIALLIVKKRDFLHKKYGFIIHNKLETIANVKNRLNITPMSPRSNILKLTYKDYNPIRARDFLNTLTQHFLHYSVSDQTETQKSKLAFINQQLALVKSKLILSENQLEKFKVSHNIADIETQRNEIIKKIAQIETEYEESKIEYQRVNLLYREIHKNNYAVLGIIGNHYPTLADMLQTLENLTAQKEAMLANLTERHPDVISIRKNIADLQTNIKKLVNAIRKDINKKYHTLTKNLTEAKKSLNAFPSQEKEFARLKRIFDVNDKMYNYLLKKQSELSIKDKALNSNKKILDKAKIAPKPLSPKLGAAIAVSTLLGLFTIAILTLYRIKKNVIVKSAVDISEISDVPIFGLIPYVENTHLYNRAYVIADPNSPASEAFRIIRTNLDYIVTDEKSKVILVTSSVPNEGKTVVSSNLAAVIGMGEKKTILVSLDLRRPELHHKFGLPNNFGMSDVLSNRKKLHDVIWRHEHFPNLHIITSGRIPPNPAELVNSKRTAEIIDTLKKEYDYVIIDTPPVKYVADAISLFKYADIKLFVLKSEFSQKKHVKEIEELIHKYKLKHCGFILNSVKEKYLNKAYFDKKYIFYDYL